MSSKVAIKVEGLSKCYQIYDQPRDRLKQSIYPRLQRIAGRQPQQYFREFWALRNVNLEINKGESLGIMGRNGSGKSSLLQIICGTLNATTGTVQTTGRIAALLELGSGFNSEFTGRENVYMNAALLGLSREETDACFDKIAQFAEIGGFIEQPVKTYSSGMVVRLAFSVAISVDPEILIVDEALSVGDELFQRKCFSRIEAIRRSGATILFVSHSAASIVELCDRAALLDAGESIAVGQPKQIVGQYQKLLYAPTDRRESIREQIRCAKLNLTANVQEIAANAGSSSSQSTQRHWLELQEQFDPNLKPTSTIEYESHGANISNVCILDLAGNPVNNLIRGKPYRYSYRVEFTRSASNVTFGMLIKTISGLELGGGTSARLPKDSVAVVQASAVFQIEYRFTCSLNTGTYFLNAGVMGDINGEHRFLHRLIDIALFRVMPDANPHGTGIIDFSCTPMVQEITPAALNDVFGR